MATLTADQPIARGMRISFGKYAQTSPIAESEDVVWIVLDAEDEKVLLLSEKVLDCKRLNDIGIDVSWETCTLRQWLNSSFMNEIFTNEEKNEIIEAELRNSSGNSTKDKVFLLSADEVEEYLGSEAGAIPTTYAERKGVKVDFKYDNTCRYWLRTGRHKGIDCDYFSYVGYSAKVDNLGVKVQSDKIGVRPAVWVKADVFQLENRNE